MTEKKSFFARKPRSLVGVDISSSGVKLVEMESSDKGFELLGFGRDDLPQATMNEKQVVEPEAVGQVIARCMKRAGIKNKSAAIAVCGSPVITKTITMPSQLTERELEEQIKLEADQYVPYPIDEINLDFTVLGQSKHGPESVDVLLAACRSETIDERLAAIESAGLKAAVVDIEDFALDNAVSSFLLPQDAEGTTLICDVGASHTTFSIFSGRKPVYRRDQSFGGQQLTEDIMRHYGMPADEANESKRTGNLPEDYATEVLPYFIDDLAQQIDRALQLFFANSNQFSSIDQIILAGGTASVPGLPAAIEQKLSVSTRLADPLAGIRIGSKVRRQAVQAEAPSLLVAMGLAMRSSDR